MITLKKGHRIHHLTNNHLFPHKALCQRLVVQDVLMHNDIPHRLSLSEAYWQVIVQDVTVKTETKDLIGELLSKKGVMRIQLVF